MLLVHPPLPASASNEGMAGDTEKPKPSSTLPQSVLDAIHGRVSAEAKRAAYGASLVSWWQARLFTSLKLHSAPPRPLPTGEAPATPRRDPASPRRRAPPPRSASAPPPPPTPVPPFSPQEYSDRKNDDEEEHVADSLLYDRSHLPRTVPAPREWVAAGRPTAAAADPRRADPAAPGLTGRPRVPVAGGGAGRGGGG